jgi:hypothetical protein
MRRRRLLSSVLLLPIAAALVAPLSASADSQPVSATVGSLLGITVSGPVVLLPLLVPGGTSTGVGTVTVVSTGPWVLRLSDGASSNAGHLQRTVGSTGATVLSDALDWSTTALHGTGGSGTLSGTATVGASGTLADAVTATYSQDVGSSELLALGSVYGLTVTWTISAS